MESDMEVISFYLGGLVFVLSWYSPALLPSRLTLLIVFATIPYLVFLIPLILLQRRETAHLGFANDVLDREKAQVTALLDAALARVRELETENAALKRGAEHGMEHGIDTTKELGDGGEAQKCALGNVVAQSMHVPGTTSQDDLIEEDGQQQPGNLDETIPKLISSFLKTPSSSEASPLEDCQDRKLDLNAAREVSEELDCMVKGIMQEAVGCSLSKSLSKSSEESMDSNSSTLLGSDALESSASNSLDIFTELRRQWSKALESEEPEAVKKEIKCRDLTLTSVYIAFENYRTQGHFRVSEEEKRKSKRLDALIEENGRSLEQDKVTSKPPQSRKRHSIAI